MAANAILILIGTLCIVNASIISINIYDGENKNKVTRSLSVKDCDNIACDQNCRRIGFPGGICVRGRCKCDILRNELEETPENKQETESSALKDCIYQACDQLCRRLGFPGGACVGDRCDCDNFKPRHGLLNISSCETAMCNDMCHLLNYAGGVCIDNSCECY